MGIEIADMANSDSSAKKRTKKAATQSRSTTSSTTAKKRKQTPTRKKPATRKKAKASATIESPTDDTADTSPTIDVTTVDVTTVDSTPDLLTAQQQQLVLQLLLRGASPAGACQQLGVSAFTFARTFRDDQHFRKRVEEVQQMLGQNVASALYRAALEGNVSAQTFWLKTKPPPGWQTDHPETDQPRTFDDFFDQLSDHELLELARAMGVDLSPEIERALFGQGGEEFTADVSS